MATALNHHGPPEVLVHAAGGASVGRSWEDPKGDFDLSLGSTAEVLDFLRHEAPEARLVYVSSAAVYGGSGGELLSEQDACVPVSPYGVHKAACEQLVLGDARMRGLQATIIRFFSLFGDGLRKQILWDVLNRAYDTSGSHLELWGTGDETRDFLHARDAGRIISAAATTHSAPLDPLILNGASGTAVTIRSLIERLLRATGVETQIEFNGKSRIGDPLHLTANTNKLSSILKFETKTDLDQGLAQYVDWFNKVKDSASPR